MKEPLDPITRGALLSQEYAEMQELLVAGAPPDKQEAIGALLRYITQVVHQQAEPSDLAVFRSYANRDPEEARAVVRVLAAEACEAAMITLMAHPGQPVPPVPEM